MLSFDSSLITALAKSATRSYWVLRLYYNDGSSFTGISDLTRTIGGVIYYGLADWGSHNQTLNIDQFTTSNGTMQVGLSNAPNKIDGKRFSDLFATNNYSNRKWELFQCDENADFSADNLIAGGIISSDIKHTPTQITMYLNDYWPKYNIGLPSRRATKALYPEVPEKNIGEPIPIWYGNFDILDDVPAGDFERHFVRGRVPALIIDKATAAGYTNVLPDSDQDSEIVLKQLNEKAIAIQSGDSFMTCDENNTIVVVNPANNTDNNLLFKGVDWYGFYSFANHDDPDSRGTDEENMYDNDFGTDGNFAMPGGEGADIITFALPSNIEQHGIDILSGTDIVILANFGTFTGTASAFSINRIMGEVVVAVVFTWGGAAYQSLSDAAAGDLVGEGEVEVNMATVGEGAANVDIIEIGIQAKTEPSATFSWKIIERGEQLYTIVDPWYGKPRIRKAGKAPDVHFKSADVDVVFISGKGREYGSWIDADSRNQGYTSGDLIENPIFMIEDILRNELGLTSSEISYTDFDAAGQDDGGGSSEGTLSDTFGDDVANIIFGFSQPKIISSKGLIEKICKQCGSYTWWSGDELTVKTRKQTYSSASQTIAFKDVKIIDFGLTPMIDVFNKIQVDYDFNYSINKTIKSRTKDDNANLEEDVATYPNGSQGTTVNGYGEVLEFNLTMPFTLDETTADNYGEAVLAWFKDRKQIITIQGKKDTARYNSLEVGDIINFSNWDSNLKVLGDTITTADGFMITQITKSPDGPRIQVTEVAGTIS